MVTADENKINDDIDKSVENEVNNDKELTKVTSDEKQQIKEDLKTNEKIKDLKNITSQVNFQNVYDNTDLQYILNGSDIKENLIINKYNDNTSFSFNINTKNVTPILQQDKSIIFFDSKDKSKKVFQIEAPYMYDKVNNSSDKIEVAINQSKNGYLLTLTPDKTWLSSSDRVYPVTIDPSMQTSLERSKIHDTFVGSLDTENKCKNQYVRVGLTPGNVGTCRTYIKFDLPTLSTGDMITNAQLNLLQCSDVSSVSSNQVNVHNVTQDFDASNLTWGTQPSYDSHIEALNMITSNQNQWVNWDVTSIVKQWFTTGNNYGIMLEQDNSSKHTAFWSSDMNDAFTSARPMISFNYINNSGIENYWTYHSQNVGRAGTSYINDYNGNLVFTHNDIDMSGSRMPVSINHVFNSNDITTSNIGFGSGWRLNINQRLESQTINNTQYYKYTDEDGTKHYFQNSGSMPINDELNLGLSLTKEGDGSLSISDKKNNKINFSSSTNDLNYIKDANGNIITFTYGGTSSSGVRNITKVTDGSGRVTSLNYNSSGILTSIQDTAGRTITYNYDGNGNLTTITYPDNKSSNYSYDGNHNLVSATNYDGYRISYQYYGIAPHRVSHLLESNTNGALGDELSVSYGNNSTTFTDVKGRRSIYQFDNVGKTLCMKDADGSAQYYKYTDSTNASKVTSESKLEKTVINLLTNHDAENSDSWGVGTDGGSGSSSFTSAVSYMGNQSLAINKTDNVSRQYFDQWNILKPGKTYTFSAYVKTVNVSNTNGEGAVISFYYKDKSGNYQRIDSNYLNGSNDWQKLQTTFNLPMDAADYNVLTRVSMLQETGTAYFDSMQLEEGGVANRYNLVDNGDLTGSSGTPNRWNTISTGGSDGLVSTSDSDHPANLDNSVYQVSGSYGVQKKLGQSINIKGKAGDIYTVGAWAKAYSVPSGTFQLQAVFSGSSGSQSVNFDFNKDSNDWQYISGRCVTNSDYSKIDIYYIYGDNANTAYFDGVQLYKEEFSKSYQYDSKGNLVSTADLATQNSKFEYNGNNDVLKAVDPKGNSFKYEYDSKHNLTRGTSAANVNYSFNYDSNGNAVSARVGDGADYIQTKADYTSSGNYIKSLTDSMGNTVSYDFDESKGLLNSITDPKGSKTSNTYDSVDNLTSTSKTVSGQQITNSYGYQNDRISQITHNGFNYNFAYDSLGNNTGVSVGNQNLITNTYEPRTSLLTKSTYGNGQSASNYYDNSDRILSRNVGGNTTVGVTYDAQLQNIGWQNPWSSDNSLAGTTGQGLRMESLKVQLTNAPSGMKIKYMAHVQNVGWQNWVYDGGIAGTVGQSLSIEALRIQLEGAPEGYNVRYQVYADGIGWMEPASNGDIAGTVGQNRRIEAIKIFVELPSYTYQYDASGNLAYKNDLENHVSYRYVYDNSNRLVKVSDSIGNMISYNYDNNNNISSINYNSSGKSYTVNYSYDADNKLKSTTYGADEYDNNYDSLGRLTNNVIKTGSTQYNVNYSYAPGAMASGIGVNYNGYVDTVGWQKTKLDGELSGTVGQSLKYQEINMNLTNVPTDTNNPLNKMKIQYQTHVSNIGWQDPVYGGTNAGAIASNYQIEAIKINLVNAPAGYHVWYQAQLQDKGWTEPVQDGAMAGTTGQSLRLEALRIYIVKPGSDSKDSNKIGTISNNGNNIGYNYDANGNIKSISQNGQTISYTYNELNEVTREDNQTLNYSMVYSYDAGGNIVSKVKYPYTTGNLGTATNNVSYSYGDGNWKDKLTSYNGKSITYDQIGNPLSYNGNTFGWKSGRQLAYMILSDGRDVGFKYNDAGIRTEKRVNGVTTKYYLDGDKVISQQDEEGTSIRYNYDANGKLVSMILNGTEYFYIRNAQSDIIGLIDTSGNQVVSYTYDTWGKLISITGSLKDTVGVKNPYRYRGYRYDTETGLYYLQSRYYNPEWGRFINADGIVGTPGELLSANMFAYCLNNPVNMADSSGNFPFVLSFFVEAVVAAVEVVATVLSAPVVVGGALIGATGLLIYSAYQYYKGHSTSYADSSTTENNKTSSSPQNKTKTSSKGRSKNKLKPDPSAQGDHTTFKRNPDTGEITNYETWRPNPKNPTGFDSAKRYDGTGSPHKNPVTGEELMPHVHDKTVPGGVRSPIPWEIPRKP
ncbi:DNRLRE domain-containing protein [Clostridium manihotivorum]|uniref:RHS repeat-associated core domain-containing protein n=1 Tax=Clostridium manihotivorum TaxID=2320868 RepID=A0A410DPV2_9CLOT|nr:DNRLRE domain-containing protein [Clostridium manihotivorum]QAA31078.1 hypothetical protein C1I91_05030 [Clostridium manihotivorum]